MSLVVPSAQAIATAIRTGSATGRGWEWAISAGKVPGMYMVHVTGADTVGTNRRVLGSGTDSYAGFLQAAATMRIRSGGNANDAAAGTGIRRVSMTGLLASGALQTVTIDTAGTSASDPTEDTYIRAWLTRATAAGTYHGTAAADIVLETSGGTEMCRIVAGRSESKLAAYAIPSGWTGFLIHATGRADVKAGKSADFWLMSAGDILTTSGDMGPAVEEFYFPGVIEALAEDHVTMESWPGPADIWIDVKAAAADTMATAGFELLIVQNSVWGLS